MDHEAIRASATERIDDLRAELAADLAADPTLDRAMSDAELVTRRLDIVDLIVHGASLRQVAKHFKISHELVRIDYAAGLELLRDRSVDRSLQLREEITARERALIFANIERAKAGDKSSAMIVQHADQVLASIWGLRSLRVETPAREGDPQLADAVTAYLHGLAAAALPSR